LVDAIESGLAVRYRDDSEWTITGGIADEAPQFNLIGYSYGSLLAAQTAWSYARKGYKVDHLVLIGSPIDGDFLSDLQSHKSIQKTTVINLVQHGDPIYAGMDQSELMAIAPLLAKQMLAGKGGGHFYYAHMVGDSPRRWMALAREIAAAGLR
jgi:pimeloyl-ACP methyl ester carboxylesterase